jgi:hypothetical protein
MSLSISQYAVIASSGLVSWIAIDLISNMLLRESEKGTQFRLKILGARWLTWEKAVIVGLIQFAIAFVASYYIQDFFTVLFTANVAYLFPIALTALGFIYAYVFALTPYKKKLVRFTPSLILIGIAVVFFFLIWSTGQYPLNLPF